MSDCRRCYLKMEKESGKNRKYKDDILNLVDNPLPKTLEENRPSLDYRNRPDCREDRLKREGENISLIQTGDLNGQNTENCYKT